MTSELLTEIDGLIRKGAPSRAALRLKEIPLKEVPRSEYRRFAWLARRAGLPQLGLRLLNPVVRPEKGVDIEPATESEKAEYGAALVGIGAVRESLEIFETIDKAKSADGILLHSFALVAQWRYAEAIPLLESFIARTEEPYQLLIGRMNLAAALVSVRELGRAETTIEECLAEAEEQGALRLMGNARELRAQVLVRRSELGRARRELGVLLTLGSDSSSIERLFARKWLAICDLRESNGSPESQRAMQAVRKEAVDRRHWETVRDVDAHLGIHVRDKKRLAHVLFGTPFPGYGKRLLDEVGAGFEPPDSYIWKVGERGAGLILDLDRGTAGDARLAPGLPAQLLRALCTDFYRPFRPAALFSELFRGEYFNPRSSAHRVHELVLRLRSWLAEEKIGLEIDQTGHGYRIGAKVRTGVRVSRERKSQTRASFSIERLKQALGEDSVLPISSERAASALGVSVRNARRILALGVSEGLLGSRGAHSNRRYYFRD